MQNLITDGRQIGHLLLQITFNAPPYLLHLMFIYLPIFVPYWMDAHKSILATPFSAQEVQQSSLEFPRPHAIQIETIENIWVHTSSICFSKFCTSIAPFNYTDNRQTNQVLPFIILENQGVFLKNHNATDIALIGWFRVLLPNQNTVLIII